MINFSTLDEYLDERIRFCRSFQNENNEFQKALEDFNWVKGQLQRDSEGEAVSWDDISSVLSPYIMKSYEMSVENHKSEFLPNNIRLEAKKIADSLLTIFNNMVDRCNQPIKSALYFS